jgi:Anti-sigma-K factor rskA/Putative zinc-finger
MTDVHSAVGSYVSDAVEAAERAEFEEHLADCESCRQEVAEFDETTAELVRLVATPPPSSLRERVLTGIREVRPLPPGEATSPTPASLDALRPASMRPASMRRRGPDWAPTASEAPDWDAPADDRADRGQWRRTGVLALAVAAALVVALALGGWVYTLQQQRETLTTQREAATRAVERERQLLSAPDARVLTRTAGGARYSFVVSRQRGEALFLGTDLPDPGPDRTYQLWTLDAAEQPVPDDLVRGFGKTQKWFSGSIGTATGLAVSIEPAEGARTPTDIRTVIPF